MSDPQLNLTVLLTHFIQLEGRSELGMMQSFWWFRFHFVRVFVFGSAAAPRNNAQPIPSGRCHLQSVPCLSLAARAGAPRSRHRRWGSGDYGTTLYAFLEISDTAN
jgi:hypothetical protein